MSLIKLPQSVGSQFLDLNCERKEVHGCNASETRDDHYYGLRWVCTYGISHPGRWNEAVSVQSYQSLCLRNVWAYGIGNNLPRSKGMVTDRDALGTRHGKLPQSTICEMQARNRLLEYANSGSMVSDGWLEDLNTTVGGLARCAARVYHVVYRKWERQEWRVSLFDGKLLDWESATASPDWVKDKPASGSVEILQLCRALE